MATRAVAVTAVSGFWSRVIQFLEPSKHHGDPGDRSCLNVDANELGFIMEEPTNKVTNPIIWLMRHAAPNSRSAFSKPNNVAIMVYYSQLEHHKRATDIHTQWSHQLDRQQEAMILQSQHLFLSKANKLVYC